MYMAADCWKKKKYIQQNGVILNQVFVVVMYLSLYQIAKTTAEKIL